MDKEKKEKQGWITIGRPGYLGKNKDEQIAKWNSEYGEGNWRLAWQLASGVVLNYEQIFRHYVESYGDYFEHHLDEALYLTSCFSYAYDKDLISKEEAFDPFFLYNKPGRPNQFHNVALNFALEYLHGLEFKGREPIQVCEGKPGTDPNTWPAGWRWSPGRIPAVHPELIPKDSLSSWWQPGSIEDLYQSAKILQIKK
jgi:hypothetical protein